MSVYSYPVRPLSFLPQYETYQHLEYSTQAVVPQKIFEQDLNRLGSHTENASLPNPTVYRIVTPFETVTHITPHFMEGIDHIYLGRQMLESLLISDPYPILHISLVFPSPPQATFISLQPETDDFAILPNLDPREVLETAFKNHYSVLTLDQPLSLKHNNTPYYFRVTSLRPNPVVLLTDAEPEIDFQPSLNPAVPPLPPPATPSSSPSSSPSGTHPSQSSSTRPPPLQINSRPQLLTPLQTPDVPLNPSLPSAFDSDDSDSDTKNPDTKFTAFSGTGNRLGDK